MKARGCRAVLHEGDDVLEEGEEEEGDEGQGQENIQEVGLTACLPACLHLAFSFGFGNGFGNSILCAPPAGKLQGSCKKLRGWSKGSYFRCISGIS